MDERNHGELSQQLERLSEQHVDRDDLLDPDQVPVKNRGDRWIMPDCPSCTERCCLHPEPDSGILLSLHDVAHLVDSGCAHLIVGTFTFKRNKRGKVLDEIDQMPRLAKQDNGDCHFYDGATGRCNGYGVRPTICRRFPYEVSYKKKSGKPFTRFIGWSQCPTVEDGEKHQDSIRQMARDAVVDENVSFEDAVLLGEHVEALRKAGFGPYLPPPSECPGARPEDAAASVG
ncbi:MAG TPA: YkgJ family cysteine cluster protein [bacterium]|nr:YkgJ family cysteine cluster protein [bacterium]